MFEKYHCVERQTNLLYFYHQLKLLNGLKFFFYPLKVYSVGKKDESRKENTWEGYISQFNLVSFRVRLLLMTSISFRNRKLGKH